MSAATLGEDSEGNAHESHTTLTVGNEFEHDSVVHVVQSVQSGVVFCHVDDAVTSQGMRVPVEIVFSQLKLGFNQ